MSTDSILGILEWCCSCSFFCLRAKVWELDAEKDILEFESSFFLKKASIVFYLLMMIFRKLEKFIYLLVLIPITLSLSNDIIIKLLAI
jgi:hypothetical protein